MNLSPFDMKNLLHHILSGKEFGVERGGEDFIGNPSAHQHKHQWVPMRKGLCTFSSSRRNWSMGSRFLLLGTGSALKGLHFLVGYSGGWAE